MATLSFLRDAHQLDQAVSKVKAGSDPSVSWVLTEVIADGDVKLVETGTDLADLCDEFADSKEMFALARLTDPNSHLAKLVLFCWCGEGVPGLRKSRFPQHLDAASAYFSGYHLRIIARDDADVDPVQIMKKMADSSGAKYSVHDQQKTPSQPPKAPVSRPVVANSTPRAVTTHAVTKPAVVSPVVATAKPVIAPKPASNVFAKPVPPAASTFKPTQVTASSSTTYKPAFAPSAAAFQSSTSTSTASSAANAAAPTASSSAGEKSARQLELEAMIKARQEREEQEYQEEMAMRSARRSRENVTVEDAAPATPAVPVPVIPAGMTKSINLGGILSAPTSTATYSPPAPAPAPVAAVRPVAQVQPPSPVAASTASTNESSASGGAAGVAAISAKFSSLAVGSGSKSSSPGTSPRTTRKWPTVGSSPSNAPIVNASVSQMVEPATTAAPAPAPAPAPRPAYVAGSTVAAPVAAAPVAVHRPAEPMPEPIVAAAAPAPVLPPRGNPVYDVEPVAAPEPVVEPTPAAEPAAPLPVDTSLPNLYVAAHPFTASDATELPLQPGDIVAIVESVDGWAVVEHIGTHARGMCPMTYLDRVLDIVMALDRPDAACVAEFEFAGNPAEGELGLRAGMLVVDVAKVDDEWLEGRGYGGEASGYFPASYVRPVADV